MATLLNCISICQASDDIKFIKMIEHKKVFYPETGETQLHINFQVLVNKSGSYILDIGFGKPGTFMGFFSNFKLSEGEQTIKGICYGDTIFERKIDLKTVNPRLLVNKEGSGITQDTIKIELPYKYKEFKRKKAKPDIKLSAQEIAYIIGESCASDQARMTGVSKETMLSPGNKALSLTKLASLSEWFKKNTPQSNKYDLWISGSHFIEGNKANFIALAKDKTEAFPVYDDESFNEYIKTLNLSIADEESVLSWAQFYLLLSKYRSMYAVLNTIPEDKDQNNQGKRHQSIQGWFASHPEVKFLKPTLYRKNKKLQFIIFSYQRLAGVLEKHEFILHPNGEIISYKNTKLATWVGNWYII